ncbi:MAG: chromate resistance protein ChrB domain-containing protein, partial [Thermomicrobiales bacterium]
MSSINTITPDRLSKLIGTPKAPVILDIRTAEDFAADPRLIPGSVPGTPDPAAIAREAAGRPVVVICHKGLKLSHGFAAYLRSEKIPADVLEGGFVAWSEAKLPLAAIGKLPKRDAKNRTHWVTRERPKVDRIACPWLIKRFVDPNAVFLFVQPSEVEAVGEKYGAAPFDCDGVFWSHRGEKCTFDVMIDEFQLEIPALRHLALMVRGADTARLDLAPEA